MFTTKPRPVPSKAALRVLYQLAYISSGTAVGVGVLCAEERRRRTQIVQRIADNAKRIRQHPRYAANAAALADGGEVWSEMVDAPRAGGKKGGKRHGFESLRGLESVRGLESEVEAVKGQDLPSVVEKEYGTLVAGKSRRKARRGESGMGSTRAISAASSIGAGHEGREQNARQPRQKDLPGPSIPGLTQPSDSSRHIKLDKREAELRDNEEDFGSYPGPLKRGPWTFTNVSNAPVAVSPVPAQCYRLLEIGKTAEAINLWTRSGNCRDQDTPGPNHLISSLFDAALEENLLTECAQLIRALPRSTPSKVPRCEELIRSLDWQGKHEDLLADFFFREEPLCKFVNLSRLSEDVRTLLANACSSNDKLFFWFERLYRTLDARHRFVIDRRRCHSLLTVTWRSTRNIEAVEAQSRPLQEHLEQMGVFDASRLVDKTMVKIYTSARCTRKALEALARIYRTDPSDLRCALRAALIYARSGSWQSFHEAIRIAENAFKNQSLEVDGGLSSRASKALHAIVQAYAKRHSASQTWRFVTDLQDRFNYWPDHFANRMILGTFVARKAISLIPHWLHRLRVAGHGWQIDGATAAQLLSRFYEVYRPSHVLMMWFCRNLTHLVPSFDPLEFTALMKKSIGYDLSGVVERNAGWQQLNAARRLDRLDTAIDHVPSPGHTYDHKLHFSPSGEESQDQGLRSLAGEQPLPDNEDAVLDAFTPSWSTRSSESVVEDEMKLALSSQQYGKVLQLYERSLDGIGLPKSIDALTFAVRVSLRKHRDDGAAMQMIRHAESAGMNVVPALAPVLIHRMQTHEPADRDSADRLCSLAIRYYHISEESGILPGHHVGVTAANVLVKGKRADFGVRLLRTIYNSKCTEDRAVDVVFMTVMIKGYAALGRLSDVLYWVRETLRLDLRISPGFCRELKHGLKAMPSLTRRERAQLHAALEACQARRQEQAFETKILGKKLVATIARCMREETTINIDERAEIDREEFGATRELRDHALVDEGFLRDERRSPLRAKRLATPNGHTHDSFGDARQADRLTDVKWMRQYRAFLRRPMVLEDGRYVSFRHYLPSESTEWRRKEKSRRDGLRAAREVVWEEGEGE